MFKEHNEQMDRLSEKNISKRYWTCYNHVAQFIHEVYKADDFRLKDIDHQFTIRIPLLLVSESILDNYTFQSSGN